MRDLGFDLPGDEPEVPTPPPPEEPSPPRRGGRFIWAFLFALVAWHIAGNFRDSADPVGRVSDEEAVAAPMYEIEAKMHYGANSLTQGMPTPFQSQFASSQARRNSTSILRRRAVVEYDLGDPRLASTLSELRERSKSLDKRLHELRQTLNPSEHDRHRIAALHSEQRANALILRLYGAGAASWSAADGGRNGISAGEMPDTAEADQELGGGFIGRLRRTHILKRDGQTARAEEIRTRAIRGAQNTLLVVIAIGGIGLIAAAAGVVLLIAYLGMLRTRRKASPLHPPLPPNEPDRADRLAGGFVVFMVLYTIGSAALAYLLPRWTSGATPEVALTLSLVVAVTMFALPLLWLFRRASSRGFSAAEIGLVLRNPGKELLWGIGGYLATLPLLIAGLLIISWLDWLPTRANSAGPMAFEARSTLAKMLTLLLAAGVAPFFEEIYFRGVLFGAMWVRTRRLWLGVLGSTLVFALLHQQFIMGLFSVGILGAAFAILYAETRSLVPGIVMHAINNAVIMQLLFILNA